MFTLYENSTLFPVGKYAENDRDLSRIATKIIAAHVAQDIDNLQDPVIIMLEMEEVAMVRFFIIIMTFVILCS